MNPFERLDGFLTKVEATADIEAVRLLLHDTISMLGFDYFACSLIDAAANPRLPFFLTNYPTEWREHYERSGLCRHDPIFRHALQTARPALWSECNRRYDIPTADRMVFGPSAEFGLAQGGGLGAHGSAGQLANLQVAGDGPARAFAGLFHEHRHELHLLAFYTHDRVLRLIDGGQQAGKRLTPKQREVLLWAVQGKTYWEIAEIMHIAEDTVRQHTQAACKRLGARTRLQAVALAICHGLIDP